MSSARLTLGTAQLGQPYGVANRRGIPTPKEVDTILETALELGVRSLDTASDYGEAEARIGDFIKRHASPASFAVCSKLPRIGTEPSPAAVEAIVSDAVESSLRRLGQDRIDCYLIHHADDLRHHGPALAEALARQRERGRVDRIGVSVYSPDEAVAVLDYPELTVVQHPLNLLDRRLVSSGRLRELSSRGVVVHARSLLLQGLLTLSPDELPRHVTHARPIVMKLRELLAEYGVAPPDVALAFVGATEGIEQVIVGVDTPEQLRSNVAALARPLPEGLVEALATRLQEAPPEVIDPRLWPAETQ